MDSLRLIYFRPRNPSWIWIRYVQHAFHKHHRNLLCRFERHSRSRQVPISPLVHCNGDNARLSPKHQTHEATRWPWILPSHIQRHAAISNIPLSYRVSKTNKPKDHEFCSARTNLLKAANKNFRSCVLL